LVRAISPLLLGAVARAVPYPFISSFFEKESLFCSIALFFVIFSCEGSSCGHQYLH
jgi:hypothetical protein